MREYQDSEAYLICVYYYDYSSAIFQKMTLERFLIPIKKDRTPEAGSTLSRCVSINAPELLSSVALVPLLKGVGTSEELIEHLSH